MHNAYKKRLLKAWIPEVSEVSETPRSECKESQHPNIVLSNGDNHSSNECLEESLSKTQQVAETVQQQQQQQELQQRQDEQQQQEKDQQEYELDEQQEDQQPGGRRIPCCKLCNNHGIHQLNKGHKYRCPYRKPEHIGICKDCQTTEERRKSTREEQKNMRAKKARPPSPVYIYNTSVSTQEFPRMKELNTETKNIIDPTLFDQINNKVLHRT